jgi:hypothetical protein
MSTQIVLISVDHNNARKICEQLENMVYPTFDSLFQTIAEKVGSNEGFIILTISQFMDEVNDQILDDLGNYFMTYVKIG